jgi:hypothetical protein
MNPERSDISTRVDPFETGFAWAVLAGEHIIQAGWEPNRGAADYSARNCARGWRFMETDRKPRRGGRINA